MKVFISYARSVEDERRCAEQIRSVLSRWGYAVWLQADLVDKDRVSSPWNREVAGTLEDARVIAVISSARNWNATIGVDVANGSADVVVIVGAGFGAPCLCGAQAVPDPKVGQTAARTISSGWTPLLSTKSGSIDPRVLVWSQDSRQNSARLYTILELSFPKGVRSHLCASYKRPDTPLNYFAAKRDIDNSRILSLPILEETRSVFDGNGNPQNLEVDEVVEGLQSPDLVSGSVDHDFERRTRLSDLERPKKGRRIDSASLFMGASYGQFGNETDHLPVAIGQLAIGFDALSHDRALCFDPNLKRRPFPSVGEQIKHLFESELSEARRRRNHAGAASLGLWRGITPLTPVDDVSNKTRSRAGLLLSKTIFSSERPRRAGASLTRSMEPFQTLQGFRSTRRQNRDYEEAGVVLRFQLIEGGLSKRTGSDGELAVERGAFSDAANRRSHFSDFFGSLRAWFDIVRPELRPVTATGGAGLVQSLQQWLELKSIQQAIGLSDPPKINGRQQQGQEDRPFQDKKQFLVLVIQNGEAKWRLAGGANDDPLTN